MNVFAYTAKLYFIKFTERRKGDRRICKSQYNFTSLSRSTAGTAELAAARMRSTIKTSRDILEKFEIICDRPVTCRDRGTNGMGCSQHRCIHFSGVYITSYFSGKLRLTSSASSIPISSSS